MVFTDIIEAMRNAQEEAENDNEENVKKTAEDACDTFEKDLDSLKSLVAKVICIPYLDAEKVVYQKSGKKHDGRMSTVVFWRDGSETHVTCAKEDKFDPVTGLCLCYMKKIAGNTTEGLRDILKPAEDYKKKGQIRK